MIWQLLNVLKTSGIENEYVRLRPELNLSSPVEVFIPIGLSIAPHHPCEAGYENLDACSFACDLAGECVRFVAFQHHRSHNLPRHACTVRHSGSYFHGCRYGRSDNDTQTGTFSDAHAHAV